MQNTARINILKKVTRQTIKYFIDPWAICSAFMEIYRYSMLFSSYSSEVRNILSILTSCRHVAKHGETNDN